MNCFASSSDISRENQNHAYVFKTLEPTNKSSINLFFGNASIDNYTALVPILVQFAGLPRLVLVGAER